MNDEDSIAEEIGAANKSPAPEGRSMTDLERLRHSAAHVLATAILRIWTERNSPRFPQSRRGSTTTSIAALI